MTNYTNVFSGSVIQPAEVSYLPVTLTADITLDWPLESNAPTYPAAGTIDVTSTVGAYAITLPDATQGSAGTAILFNGLSANTQTVAIKDNGGTSVASMSSGTQWLLVLAGTATAAGTWRAFQLGATTSAATAASLAGYGIVASSGLLSQAAAVTTFSSSPRTVLVTDRASLMVWTGTGSSTFSLPAAATAGNNFFVMARNSGGGDMTVDPSGSETINGTSTVALHPGDSAFLITDGLAWYSVGLGRDAAFAFDFTSISLAGAAATYTLSGAELNRVAYKFTGLLTNDVAVVVPATVQQYWAENATTGAFAVTLKTSGGTPVSVTQGGRDIYYCNGTNVVRATTGGIAVPIGVTDGGTGLSSYAAGDIVYASGATTLGKLADVATGNALLSGGVGVAPAYGKVGLTTHVSGTLPTANGGTGTTSTTGTGSVVFSVSPTFTGAPLAPTAAPGTNTTQIATTAFVTAAISASGGGTVTSINASGGTTGLSFSGGPVTSSGTLTMSGTLAVANGGTGITAFGTGVATALGVNVGSAGALVTFNGALGTPSSGTATNITGLPITAGTTGTLGVARGGTGATATPTNGQLLIGNGTTFTVASLTAGTNITLTPGAGTLQIDAAGGGSMVYPGAGIAVSTGAAWTTSLSSTAPIFTTSVTSPIVQGGSAASSTLVIQSTSGAGTSDSITFKTASQATAGRISTGQNWGIGGTESSDARLAVKGNVVGAATFGYGVLLQPTFQSGVTNTANVFNSNPSTQATAFTITQFTHYATTFNTLGAGSAITTQYAFHAASGLTQATNNRAFVGDITSSGTANWNAYMAGTAPNYFNGYTVLGTTAQSGSNQLTVAGGVGMTNETYTTSYTVATLPAGVQGMRAYVTDATAPTFMGTLTGGGAVKCPVFYNGSAWVPG